MLALATCAELPAEANELPLVRALADAGVEHRWAVWDDPAEVWSDYDGVLIRTTWDYIGKADAFRAWADEVASVTTLWNPAALVRWNSHKSYLVDLAAGGVPLPPTSVLRGEVTNADGAIGQIERDGWMARAIDDGVVVKPAQSVGSHGLSVWRPEPGDARAHLDLAGHAADALRTDGHDVVLQPLLPSITTSGEVSLVLIDGDPTHAVRKLPSDGDIRSQPEHGGQLSEAPIEDEVVELGRAACARAAEVAGIRVVDLVYARVDVVLDGERPVLMELEVIEPDLFFGFGPACAARLVDAVRARRT